MALEPITRQEQIIAGKDLEPITRMEKFLKQYGGGSGVDKVLDTNGKLLNSVLPEGYPYAEVKETVLIPEETVAFVADSDGNYSGITSVNIDLEEGKTYTVNFDGKTYECICGFFAQGGMLYIGNFARVIGKGDTGEPFVYLPEETTNVWVAFEGTEHTISVSERTETIVPLDPKFISGGGAKFTHISEDDEGNLTSSMTYAEIAEALSNGSMVYCVYGQFLLHLTYGTALSDIMPFVGLPTMFRFTTMEYETLHTVRIEEDDNVYYDQSIFALAN